jgi:hypothetical protein
LACRPLLIFSDLSPIDILTYSLIIRVADDTKNEMKTSRKCAKESEDNLTFLNWQGMRVRIKIYSIEDTMIRKEQSHGGQ